MQYRNAPIQEAVFDIRVPTVLNHNIPSYESIGAAKFPDFTKIARVQKFGGQIRFTPQASHIDTSATELGVVFSNPSDTRRIQFRKDGYTFNMLRPYTKWEEFSGDALNYWGIYKKEIQPIGISRLGLRYINRIEIPKENLDFDDYFINVPRIPEGLPQMFNGLFLKMQALCNMDGGIIANITETFETPTKGKIHFILDIDVVKIDMKDQNDKMLGGYFDELRKFKNFIFESLITDKTRSLFN